MNVIVGNSQQNLLSNLDVDIIKSISGTYSATEIVEMFKNFFFNKMVLDVTALKDYNSLQTYQTLATGLDSDKIVYFLPENSDLCTAVFFSNLVSLGIYNFTTNIEGVKYLLKHSNTLNDVAQFKNVQHQYVENVNDNSGLDLPQHTIESDYNSNPPQPVIANVSASAPSFSGCKIIGIKSVTDGAGATTLTYMMKKALASRLGNNVVAVEIDKSDFKLFGEKNMFSVSKAEINNFLEQHGSASVILIDLNSHKGDFICQDTIYLLEPSIVKLNKLLRGGVEALKKLKNRKVILNKSLLSNQDVSDFEYESNIKVFYNLPPLDERKKNSVVDDLLARLGLMSGGNHTDNSNKVFGLFRK